VLAGNGVPVATAIGVIVGAGVGVCDCAPGAAQSAIAAKRIRCIGRMSFSSRRKASDRLTRVAGSSLRRARDFGCQQYRIVDYRVTKNRIVRLRMFVTASERCRNRCYDFATTKMPNERPNNYRCRTGAYRARTLQLKGGNTKTAEQVIQSHLCSIRTGVVSIFAAAESITATPHRVRARPAQPSIVHATFHPDRTQIP